MDARVHDRRRRHCRRSVVLILAVVKGLRRRRRPDLHALSFLSSTSALRSVLWCGKGAVGSCASLWANMRRASEGEREKNRKAMKESVRQLPRSPSLRLPRALVTASAPLFSTSHSSAFFGIDLTAISLKGAEISPLFFSPLVHLVLLHFSLSRSLSVPLSTPSLLHPPPSPHRCGCTRHGRGAHHRRAARRLWLPQQRALLQVCLCVRRRVAPARGPRCRADAGRHPSGRPRRQVGPPHRYVCSRRR